MCVKYALDANTSLTTVELRRYLYTLPARFEFRHEKIVEMRRELRTVLATMIAKNHETMLFGNVPLATRVFFPPEEWNADHRNTSHSHNGRPCARKLERGEPNHRCLTCGVDDTCVLCTYCYNPSDHVGHNVFVKISSRDDGGICDCGDTEAWTREVHCQADTGPEASKPLPEDFVAQAREVFDIMFDYSVDVLSKASIATQISKTRTKLEQLAKSGALNPELYGVDPYDGSAECDKWCLLVWDDDRRSLSDLYTALKLATGRAEEFLQMILSQAQTAGRATVAVSSNINELIGIRSKIRCFTSSIRPLSDVLREEMVLEIIKLALDLCHCSVVGFEPTALVSLVAKSLLEPWNVGVYPWKPECTSPEPMDNSSTSPEPNAEVYAKSNLEYYRIPQAEHQNEVTPCILGQSDDTQLGQDSDDDSFQPNDEELFGPQALANTFAMLGQLLRDRMPSHVFNWPLEHDTVRVKYLIFFDIRLFKQLRQKLTDLYIAALVSNLELKMQVAMLYADIYPRLVDQYSKIDRDPELSVTTSLSTQLFTTPSIATKLMQTDAFGVYMNMFCMQYMKNGHLNPAAFKNRRLGQVFHDFRNLLWRNHSKKLVGGNPSRVIQTAFFLSMFQGLVPLIRQTDQHVEYENERWIYCYAIMSFALQLARGVAMGIDEAFAANDPAAMYGIQAIAVPLMEWQRALTEVAGRCTCAGSDASGAPRTVARMVSFRDPNESEPIPISINSVEVSRNPVSLLNPVHCFLSFLIQFSKVRNATVLSNMLCLQKQSSFALFDAHVCSLALLSHISVGYWVRNGYSLRIQLQCYRDGTLRDLAFSQDIYMIQVALCLLNPNITFLNLVDHFAVAEWPNRTLGDSQQATYIMDEFLQCLIFLLCDRLRFVGLSSTDLTRALLRKEILQMLGFEMIQYSDLIKVVPENMSGDEHFDTMLAEIATFTPPVGEQGAGKYSLKPELYKEFDPYYTHFSTSQTENAVKAVETKIGSDYLPPVILLEGAWSRLRKFTHATSFASFIINLCAELVQNEHYQTGSYGRVLHLLLMAAQEDLMAPPPNASAIPPDSLRPNFGCYESVATMALEFSEPIAGENITIVDVLQRSLTQPHLVTLHSKIKQLLHILHQKDPRVPQVNCVQLSGADSISEQRAKQKEKGKRMQEKVMADFLRQQKEFMENYQEESNEEHIVDEDDIPIEEEVNNDDTSEGYTYPKHCVFCRMPDDQDSIFGVLTYTSKSDVMRSLPLKDPYWVKEAFAESPSFDVAHPISQALPDLGQKHYHCDSECNAEEHQPGVSWGYAFPKGDIRETTLVHGCGHGVHYRCYQEFIKFSQHQRMTTRIGSEKNDNDFLCPLCRGLNNGFMPVLWNKNTLDTTTFYAESTDPRQDMVRAMEGDEEEQHLSTVTEKLVASLNDRFVGAIEQHDFNDKFHSSVREVLFQQLGRIKSDSPKNATDLTLGLRPLYRSMACTVAHIEVSHRGQRHTTPFGGILPDQLPVQTTQFLRVFAKYIQTLSAFTISRCMRAGNNSICIDDVKILPLESLTRAVEMLFLGKDVRGITAKTILRQVFVVEFCRVIQLTPQMDRSKLGTELPEIDAEIAYSISRWSNQDPKLIYAVAQYHWTVFLRRLTLISFAMCGKYDPDDYVGIMHLPEHDRLLSYLQLPDMATFIKSFGDPNSAEAYALSKFSQMGHLDQPDRFQFQFIDYPGIYRLIKLPNRLDTMFNVKDQRLPLDPAICLFCGHLCSIQDSGFQEIGPCNTHMASCGVTQGIFLLPRRNVLLLLLPSGRGTFMPAPYLDLHGEPDEMMRRGRPHYLQCVRYDALMRDVWLRNGLPSLVSRRLDQAQDTGGWETL